MALPSTTPANFPQGLDVVSIASIDYIADSIDLDTQTTRGINRTDENGDWAEQQTRASSDPIEGTMTLQKALTTTAFPSAGVEFTHDFDDSGTSSTLRVLNVKAARSKDEADVFEIGVLLVTYQG
tara:strand:- start:6982 stop:7356 length:375 start_codon:yes stop_codon:yes gene_type:complete